LRATRVPFGLADGRFNVGLAFGKGVPHHQYANSLIQLHETLFAWALTQQIDRNPFWVGICRFRVLNYFSKTRSIGAHVFSEFSLSK
jgi:hypothetical protein